MPQNHSRTFDLKFQTKKINSATVRELYERLIRHSMAELNGVTVRYTSDYAHLEVNGQWFARLYAQKTKMAIDVRGTYDRYPNFRSITRGKTFADGKTINFHLSEHADHRDAVQLLQIAHLLKFGGTLNESIQQEIVYPNELSSEEKYHEGATQRVTVNRYERDPKARQVCINHFGASCSVCSMCFSEVYGELGKGFIHVHHLIPISEVRDNYQVDPKTDLRPICPNCHSMIHRHSPMLSIDELKQLLKRR